MGVLPTLADRILAEETPDDLQGAIVSLVRKRAAQLRDVPRPDRIRRVMAYLARRGYSGPEARKAVMAFAGPSLETGDKRREAEI
jgi:hypothetical protein